MNWMRIECEVCGAKVDEYCTEKDSSRDFHPMETPHAERVVAASKEEKS